MEFLLWIKHKTHRSDMTDTITAFERVKARIPRVHSERDYMNSISSNLRIHLAELKQKLNTLCMHFDTHPKMVLSDKAVITERKRIATSLGIYLGTDALAEEIRLILSLYLLKVAKEAAAEFAANEELEQKAMAGDYSAITCVQPSSFYFRVVLNGCIRTMRADLERFCQLYWAKSLAEFLE